MKITKQVKREARQLLLLCLVDGAVDEDRVRHVVRQVAAAGRRDGPAILSHFRRLVRLAVGRRTAIVESATPLPPDLQATIQAGLTTRYGPGLATTFAHRPALIGGIRIRVGSDVYDGSVRAGLAALARSF
jgi:F-type H+-transporting ATPase subunit delta